MLTDDGYKKLDFDLTIDTVTSYADNRRLILGHSTSKD